MAVTVFVSEEVDSVLSVTVVQWLTLSPHSTMVLGDGSEIACSPGVSVGSLCFLVKTCRCWLIRLSRAEWGFRELYK